MQPQTYTETTSDLFLEEPVIYGSFWERFGAVFIDYLILMIPAFAIQYLLPEALGSVVSVVFYWLYFALMESSSRQATIGKKAMGLIVTDEAGNQIGFLQATGRYFGRILSTLILFIGYFMMLWDKKSQTLHDKLSNCLVVKK